MGQQPSAAAPQSIGALPSNTMQPPSRRQSQQQSIPHQSIPHQPYQQNLGYQSMMMGNYGIPTSHGPNEPEMLRPNHPTYSLPPPNSSRPMDQFAGWPEAPAAMGSTPQMGRPIGSIGQVGGPSIGKVGSSASIGQVGSSTPSIGRVSVGQKGPPNPRGIGQVSGASIGQVGSSIGQVGGTSIGQVGSNIGQVGGPSIGHAGSGIGQIGGPSIGHAGSGIGQIGGPSIGHAGSGTGQVGGPSIGHAGSGIGQIGGPSIGHAGSGTRQVGGGGSDLALVRPNMGHLPHSLSAKQAALLNYATSGPMGQMGQGSMMGWGMGGQQPQQHGMIGTLGGAPQAANPYAQGMGNAAGMYGYGHGNMMGMQGVGTANRPGNSNAPSQYGDSNGPPSLPNHVSIHSVPDSVGGASEPGLDKLTSAASLASNIRGPKVLSGVCPPPPPPPHLPPLTHRIAAQLSRVCQASIRVDLQWCVLHFTSAASMQQLLGLHCPSEALPELSCLPALYQRGCCRRRSMPSKEMPQ